MTVGDERTLTTRMLDLVSEGHIQSDELVAAARRLDDAALAYAQSLGGDQEVKNLLAAWADARKLWSACTGENLI